MTQYFVYILLLRILLEPKIIIIFHDETFSLVSLISYWNNSQDISPAGRVYIYLPNVYVIHIYTRGLDEKSLESSYTMLLRTCNKLCSAAGWPCAGFAVILFYVSPCRHVLCFPLYANAIPLDWMIPFILDVVYRMEPAKDIFAYPSKRLMLGSQNKKQCCWPCNNL